MSKLKEAYYAKKLSKIIKNTSAKVTSDVDIQSPEWIFSLHIKNKLHYLLLNVLELLVFC